MTTIDLATYHRKLPIIKDICRTRETIWFNPETRDQLDTTATSLNKDSINEAIARMIRFRPLLVKIFTELGSSGGAIESPLVPLHHPEEFFPLAHMPSGAQQRFLVKCDNLLPVSGSIKARGGFYTVLHHGEQLATRAGLLDTTSSYEQLGEAKARNLFGEHSISVGSTGNLGLSIGIMGARLGFKVSVHMSSDARDWKKRLLRDAGVEVIEHSGDYGKAVAAGRLQAEQDPNCFFIDDENSTELFLGYSCAAAEVARQLARQQITVDSDHPLFVYLPCGVGGGPGGITFGLKQLFGNTVHCFFVEPTHAPCMLLGLATDLHDRISVEDFGLDGKTAADGLAVGRPSGFVGRILKPWIDGVTTVADQTLYRLLKKVADMEDIHLEPSALAGFAGCRLLLDRAGSGTAPNPYHGIKNATHIIWATGGSMVPADEAARYYQLGVQASKAGRN